MINLSKFLVCPRSFYLKYLSLNNNVNISDYGANILANCIK